MKRRMCYIVVALLGWVSVTSMPFPSYDAAHKQGKPAIYKLSLTSASLSLSYCAQSFVWFTPFVWGKKKICFFVTFCSYKDISTWFQIFLIWWNCDDRWTNKPNFSSPWSCLGNETGKYISLSFSMCRFCFVRLAWFQIFVCLIRQLKVWKQLTTGMKNSTEGWVGLGQDRQAVSTNVRAAFLVTRFRYQLLQTALDLKIPITSQKDGNASVVLLSSTHKCSCSMSDSGWWVQYFYFV